MKTFIFSLSFLMVFSSFGDKISVSSKVDRKTIPLNGSFVFSVVIQYEKKKPKNIDIPNLSEMTDFHVLDQWSSSRSSVSIINGSIEKTKSLEISYRLQAKSKGTLRLDSLQVRVDGKNYKTDPFFITVTEKQDQPSSSLPPSSFGMPPNSLFDSFFKHTNPFADQPRVSLDEALKLQTKTKSLSVYEGEAFPVNWILLLSSGSVQYEVYKRPKLEGFWKEELLVDGREKFLGTEIINNIVYRKNLLDSMMLFPLKSGVLNVDSYFLKVRSIFGFRSKEKIKISPKRTVHVKPLPIEGQRFFSGAVGEFTVEAFLDVQEAKVNEPITYRISFRGNGHPQFIKLPDLSWPSDFQTYSPTEKSKFEIQGKSFKNYEIILVPKKEGLLFVPSFEISTFSPKEKKYVYHQTPSFQIKVLKGESRINEEEQFFNTKDFLSRKAISFEELEMSQWPSFLNHSTLLKLWLVFYTCFCFLFFAFYLWPFQKKKETGREKIRKGLRKVEKYLEKNSWKKAAIQLIDLAYLILYQFDTKGSEGEWKKLIGHLPPSLYKKHGSDMTYLMESLEKISFSPIKFSDKEALSQTKKLHEFAKRLFTRLFADGDM